MFSLNIDYTNKFIWTSIQQLRKEVGIEEQAMDIVEQRNIEAATAAKAQESREKAAEKRMEHAMKQAELEQMAHSFDDLSDAEIRKEEALKDEV